jgi:hypothetical protein
MIDDAIEARLAFAASDQTLALGGESPPTSSGLVGRARGVVRCSAP